MKTTWIRKEGAEELLLFFNGWGMDHRIAASLLGESSSSGFDSDLLVCYDYHTLDPGPDFLAEVSRYRHRTVIAWSMGVWVARQIALPAIDRAIALNGTLHPVDARRGISREVFQATLLSYSEESRHRFNRRMCGGREALAHFELVAPDRTASDQQEELARLQEHFSSPPSACGEPWNYTHAVIGGRDLVFPSEQQYTAWKGVPQTIIADMAHFPFYHFRTLQELLACIR